MHFTAYPSREVFSRGRAGGKVVPVWMTVVADVETPVSAFSKLGNSAPSFLLESAETNDLVGRYSFVGCGARLAIQAQGKEVCVERDGKKKSYPVEDDPFKELERIMAGFPADPHPELPGCWGGAVGFLSYDSIRWFEPSIGPAPKDEVQAPDLYFVIPESTLIFDHHERQLRIVSPAFPADGTDAEAFEAACLRIQKILDALQQPSSFRPLMPDETENLPEIQSNTTKEEYFSMVHQAQEYIRAGDIFQIVPSQRFEADFPGDALDLYRALRFVNPSPYMFCLRCGDGLSLVGSSPEVHVRLTGTRVDIRPIAGTRKRGETPEADQALAEELLSDSKECAEHLMLVDLARNDVGRIAETASVQVSDFMTIERYSHVMHIVSHVCGTLAGNRNAFDVMRATFPAGTVSGAPKVRAMQIINELEKSKRCVYSGAVGYFRFDGDSDSCIALRTVVLKNGRAFVQAGGGVVADSTPEGEYQETVNKARAALRAIALASTLRS